ncbi:hypothetical protein SEA_AVOCADO_64 [Mycobacterium phage Avocado]|uniref:Uncharacterized protein n=1 Tax=Mycobacterium phage Avocado TaxID=2024302 RepID=A0A222YYC9_9CAUD|nr:hypothetical protein KDW73_gp64 [Mycobacterium phage Avocado]ASR77269.1 hypothetical protein SEA_AVOCADO_64 [Mycobacterium phage Avocado]
MRSGVLPPTTRAPIRRPGPLLRDSPRQTNRCTFTPRDERCSCILNHRTDPDQAEQQPHAVAIR